jgi:Lanthionine-containing peptide SapB precursor RamS
MALLDIQAMNAARDSKDQRGGGGGGGGGCGGGSNLSLLLCDSVASVTLCL